ncbi:hypothetical protein [Acuticoccus yangtzensis]|uniref:hypothetical protein n=1 Tax=Acuticoccus yangtzensis TaxID=1443441 RepID=UPI000ADCF586|nr:hypothetical protein [Acuticoccus yangtzensis]
MISSIVDFILLAALAGTSGAVLLMYRRLQRFDALQNAAAKEFARSSEALDRAREAMTRLSDDGGKMALTLAGRLNEARVMMNEIEEATTRTRGAYVEIAEFELSRPPVARPEPAVVSRQDAGSAATAATTATATVPVAGPPTAPQPGHGAPAGPSPAHVHPAGIEVIDDGADVAAEQPRTIPAAIRIRDAARARIAEARKKAAAAHDARPEGPRAPRPLQAALAGVEARAALAATTSRVALPAPAHLHAPAQGEAPAQAHAQAPATVAAAAGAVPGQTFAEDPAGAVIGPVLPQSAALRTPDDGLRTAASAIPAADIGTAPATSDAADHGEAALSSAAAPWPGAATAGPAAAGPSNSEAIRMLVKPAGAAPVNTDVGMAEQIGAAGTDDLDDGNAAETSPEFDAVMAAMNGRNVTWSELASAAQRSA